MKVPGTGDIFNSLDVVVNSADISQAQIGAFGGNFISDTNAHTPTEGFVFMAIQVIEEAVIAAYLPAFDGNTFTAVTLAAGTVIFGRFTTVTLTSGSVLAYEGT